MVGGVAATVETCSVVGAHPESATLTAIAAPAAIVTLVIAFSSYLPTEIDAHLL
jgi:hypothetical protein